MHVRPPTITQEGKRFVAVGNPVPGMYVVTRNFNGRIGRQSYHMKCSGEKTKPTDITYFEERNTSTTHLNMFVCEKPYYPPTRSNTPLSEELHLETTKKICLLYR